MIGSSVGMMTSGSREAYPNRQPTDRPQKFASVVSPLSHNKG